MAFERLIKRTVWIAECTCGDKAVRDDNPPRERRCLCGRWVPYIEQSAIGPDLSHSGSAAATRKR